MFENLSLLFHPHSRQCSYNPSPRWQAYGRALDLSSSRPLRRVRNLPAFWQRCYSGMFILAESGTLNLIRLSWASIKQKQLKQEGLVGHDFLLGVDFAANNVQCVHNSLKLYSNIPLSLVTIDILRQDERDEIDKVFEDVSEIMHMNPRARVLLNLDADTFNGIPSSGTPRCLRKILISCFSDQH